MKPVLVTATPEVAGRMLVELLLDYHAEIADEDGTTTTIAIEPDEELKRGTVIYRVIQASRNVDQAFPHARMYLVTEDGNRWRLPPPALEPD